jgi:phosphoribosylanthranilate isomerase
MSVKIKICGITQYEDARVAAGLGVDALGFIFYKKSRRYITPQDAGKIIQKLPPFIARVGVFVNEPVESILETARLSGIDTVQLHGKESPEYAKRLPFTVIRAFAVKPGWDMSVMDEWDVSGYLLDTWDRGSAGGTGKTFDWALARDAALKHKNIVLAGGLNPVNVLEALETVQPWAIDLNSGVEIKPGIKNPHKMKEAVKIIRAWK